MHNIVVLIDLCGRALVYFDLILVQYGAHTENVAVVLVLDNFHHAI